MSIITFFSNVCIYVHIYMLHTHIYILHMYIYIYILHIYVYIRRYVISWCSHAQSHNPLIKHRFLTVPNECATSSAVLLWRPEAPFLWPCCGNKQIVGENHGYHTIISYVYIWVNYNISLTRILRPFGDDFPQSNHDSSEVAVRSL